MDWHTKVSKRPLLSKRPLPRVHPTTGIRKCNSPPLLHASLRSDSPQQDNWSGFTFDSHLFPYPADTMAYLKALGLPVTLNLHDASGVNNWDAMFPALINYLGLPANSTKVPFNLLNATVAYAVEDIVLGDLINDKGVAFWW